jgi:hypothetical protein
MTITYRHRPPSPRLDLLFEDPDATPPPPHVARLLDAARELGDRVSVREAVLLLAWARHAAGIRPTYRSAVHRLGLPPKVAIDHCNALRREGLWPTPGWKAEDAPPPAEPQSAEKPKAEWERTHSPSPSEIARLAAEVKAVAFARKAREGKGCVHKAKLMEREERTLGLVRRNGQALDGRETANG